MENTALKSLWRQVLVILICFRVAPQGAYAAETPESTCNGSPDLCSLGIGYQTFVGLWGAGAPDPRQGSDCPALSAMKIEDALSCGLRYFAMSVCASGSEIYSCRGDKPGQRLADVLSEVADWLTADTNTREVILISLDSLPSADMDIGALASMVSNTFGDHLVLPATLQQAPSLESLIEADNRVVIFWSSELFKKLEEASSSEGADSSAQEYTRLFIPESAYVTSAALDAASASSVQAMKDGIAGVCEQSMEWLGPMVRVDAPPHALDGSINSSGCLADAVTQATLAVLTQGRLDSLEASPLRHLQENCCKKSRQLSLVALPAFGMTWRDALTLAGLARSLNERSVANNAYIAGSLEVLPGPFMDAVRDYKEQMPSPPTIAPAESSDSSPSDAHESDTEQEKPAQTSSRRLGNNRAQPSDSEAVSQDDVIAFLVSTGGLPSEDSQSKRIEVDQQAFALDASSTQPASIPFKILASPGQAMPLSNQGVLTSLRSAAMKGDSGLVSVSAECRDPGNPVGGTRRLMSSGGYIEGAVVQFTCYWGLQVNGSSYRVCGKDALFTGVQPACVPEEPGALTTGEVAFWQKILMCLVLFAECLCCSWCCWQCLFWHRIWTVRSAARALFYTFHQPERGLVSKKDVLQTVESIEADTQGLVDLESFRRAFEINAAGSNYDALPSDPRPGGRRPADYSWSVGSR